MDSQYTAMQDTKEETTKTTTTSSISQAALTMTLRPITILSSHTKTAGWHLISDQLKQKATSTMTRMRGTTFPWARLSSVKLMPLTSMSKTTISSLTSGTQRKITRRPTRSTSKSRRSLPMSQEQVPSRGENSGTRLRSNSTRTRWTTRTSSRFGKAALTLLRLNRCAVASPTSTRKAGAANLPQNSVNLTTQPST